MSATSGDATGRLLDRELTADDLREATARVSKPQDFSSQRAAQQAALLFRIGAEWFAVPSAIVDEIGAVPTRHVLPHRRAIVEGIVNVRGQIVTLVSLATLLGIEGRGTAAARRLIVLRRDALRVACVADEVAGVVRYAADALQPPPSTLSRASATYTASLLSDGDRTAAVLDDELLFYSIAKGLL